MRYFYTITTQHTGRTGAQIIATGSGTIDVLPSETERDVYNRVLDRELERLHADSAVTSVSFYRLVPNELTRDR